MAPGPIIGASDPEEVEGAPVGGAEAAEAAEPEEVGNGPAEPEEVSEGGGARRPFGIAPRRGPSPKATTASRFVYTYSLVALVDKAEEEERERRGPRKEPKEKEAKETKEPKRMGNPKGEACGEPHRRWRSAEALQRKKGKRAKGKGTGKRGEGKPVVESPTHILDPCGPGHPRRSF